MPDLAITVESAEVVPFAAAPTLASDCAWRMPTREEIIHTVVLRCQIQIEVTRRRYSGFDQERLARSVRRAGALGPDAAQSAVDQHQPVVPQFTAKPRSIRRYPALSISASPPPSISTAWRMATFPVCLMFSGTVFYADPGDRCRWRPFLGQGNEIPAAAKVWKDMMDAYYPNSAWLCLRRDVFEELQRFKVERGIPYMGAGASKLLLSARGRKRRCAMNISAVEKIADAVLYEGYILYPYRASAVKNQQRFNFGVLYPREYCELQRGLGMLGNADRMPGGGQRSTRSKSRRAFCKWQARQEWQEGQERKIGSRLARPDIAAQPSRQCSAFHPAGDRGGAGVHGACKSTSDLFKVALHVRNLSVFDDASDRSRGPGAAAIHGFGAQYSAGTGGEFVSRSILRSN